MINWSFVILFLLLIRVNINMDKLHNKTYKLVDDFCKKKNKLTKNINKNSTKVSSGLISDVPYKCCFYCQKVFINSKFLMKHLLRRHSDELILVYKNFTDREFNNDALIDILKKEFSSLKKFFSATLDVDGKHETEEDQTVIGEETLHTIERHQNVSKHVSNEIRDLKEKILDVENKLNDKFIQLDNVLKNEVSMKQDVSEKLALSEEKIIESQESQFIQLRQTLLSELKSLLCNQREEISDKCKSQLLELRYEIKRLNNVLDAKQLTCTNSLKDEIKKELMPHIVPHIHKRKCKNRKLKHSLSKTELSVSKSYLTSSPQLFSHENFGCKESNSENIFENDVTITSVVADKLSQFSIAPNTSKISSADFNEKENLLRIEKDRLSKKYDNFKEIYHKVDLRAKQITLNKLKSNKHHKVKFADPLTSTKDNLNHPSFEDGTHELSFLVENRNKPFNSAKKCMPSDSRSLSLKKAHSTPESTSFIFPDKGASGDSVLQFSNKPKYSKLNSVKEEYETFDSIEDVQNLKDFTISLKDSITAAEQSEYETQSNNFSSSAIEKRKLNPSMNNCFVQFKDSASCTSLSKGDDGDSVSIKHSMPMKRAKLSSFKRFETSGPMENFQNSKNLNTTFTKSSMIVTTEQSKYKKQLNSVSPSEHRISNSAINGHSAQIKETANTSDKFSKFKDHSKYDEDLDDVSSLEMYDLSNDDDHSDNS